MKINYTKLAGLIIFSLFFVSSFAFAQTDEKEEIVNELILKDNAKKLEKLMSKDEEFKNYVLTHVSNTQKTYLQLAIDGCKMKVVELLTENKAILGHSEEYSEQILDIYIDNLGCFLEQKKEGCSIDVYSHLVRNDYVRIRPTLLGRLNCYADVQPDWYILMQPVVEELIKKGLKVEESIINITGIRENYLLDLCKQEKRHSQESTKEEIAAVRNYILFLKEQGVDFHANINDQRPIDLLSEHLQKEME